MSDVPYKCEDCGKEFSQGQYLEFMWHRNWAHKKEERKK